jgi:hypothetical protein
MINAVNNALNRAALSSLEQEKHVRSLNPAVLLDILHFVRCAPNNCIFAAVVYFRSTCLLTQVVIGTLYQAWARLRRCRQQPDWLLGSAPGPAG